MVCPSLCLPVPAVDVLHNASYCPCRYSTPFRLGPVCGPIQVVLPVTAFLMRVFCLGLVLQWRPDCPVADPDRSLGEGTDITIVHFLTCTVIDIMFKIMSLGT